MGFAPHSRGSPFSLLCLLCIKTKFLLVMSNCGDVHPDVTRVVFDQSRPLVVFVAQHDCEVIGLHQLELMAQQAIREPTVRAAHVGVECSEREVRGARV